MFIKITCASCGSDLDLDTAIKSVRWIPGKLICTKCAKQEEDEKKK